MLEDIERILRTIHIMFAKAEKVKNSEDKIIVEKKKVFALLEELNHEVYDAMDRFEESKVSKELAKKRLREEGEQIISNASKNAEEIYASSILYTDDALRELENVIENANKTVVKVYEEVARQMQDQIEMMRDNRSELREQLSGLADSGRYLELLKRPNKANVLDELDELKQELKKKQIEEMKRIAAQKAQSSQITAANPIRIEQKSEEIHKQDKKEYLKQLTEVAAAQEVQREQPENETIITEKKEEFIETGISADEDAIPDEFDNVEEFPQNVRAILENVDLDAEYFQWKEEQEKGKKEASGENEEKKNVIFGKKGIFKRK